MVGQMIELKELFSFDPTQLHEGSDCWAKRLPDGRYRVRAVGQHCYLGEGRGLQRNRNGRRYPADKTWGRHTTESAEFMRRVKARRVTGQVEHPESGRSSMGAAAVVITKVEPPRSTDGKVFIEFETMHTPGGQIIEGFIRSNVGFGISSRGNGSVIQVDGVDEVQEDFEPVTFDCVHDESTPGAEVAASAIRESLDALVASAGSLEEALRRDRAAAERELERIGTPQQENMGLANTGTVPSAGDAVAQFAVVPVAQTGAGTFSPPANNGGEWILGTPDQKGHYRAFEGGPASYSVWYYPSAGVPVPVADGLRTKRDAVKAAEDHLQHVLGEGYQILDPAPFEGVTMRIRLDSEDEAKKALKALEKAGFQVVAGAAQSFDVNTKYADPDAAVEHVGRVLRDADIPMAVSEAEACQAHEELDVDDEMDFADEIGIGDDDETGELDYGPEDDYGIGAEDDEFDMDSEGDMMSDEEEDMYEQADVSTPMIGDPDTMPDDLEMADDIGDEYEGMDPEDIDLDLDVNERRRQMTRRRRVAEDYETGDQRKNAAVKAGGASADTTDAGAPQRKQSDLVKMGGSADTSGGQGEIRPDQRKPNEAGSELPDKGKGSSEPQKAAKMAEAIVRRALPDLAEAWRKGNAKRATQILQFIERATKATYPHLKAAGRTRFLESEVARLDDENLRLRALTEAMAEVQRTEVLLYERKLLLKDHPELAPMEERLERCDTVQEMQDEAAALLKLLGARRSVQQESTPPLAEELAESPSEPRTFVMRRQAGGTSVESASVAGDVKPLTEAAVASVPTLSTPAPRNAGDTATRLTEYRRRRRGC